MRAFIAIELPEELKEKIFAIGQKVTKGLNIKLVEKENLHLTLLFLGEISEDKRDKIREELGELEGQGKIKLRLGKVDVFPDAKRPYGVWINVEGEKEKLFSLYKKIVEGVLKAGIKLEEKFRRFSSHITIGRFKGKVGENREIGPAFAPPIWRASAGKDIGEDFTVEKVAFFQSKLSPKGPKYGKIAEFKVK